MKISYFMLRPLDFVHLLLVALIPKDRHTVIGTIDLRDDFWIAMIIVIATVFFDYE